jgi:hypothetical protein
VESLPLVDVVIVAVKCTPLAVGFPVAVASTPRCFSHECLD